jgi:hypothetical protein
MTIEYKDSKYTFEDFLNDKCCPSELQTNNSPEGFERWLESLDVQDVIDYAEMFGKCRFLDGREYELKAPTGNSL